MFEQLSAMRKTGALRNGTPYRVWSRQLNLAIVLLTLAGCGSGSQYRYSFPSRGGAQRSLPYQNSTSRGSETQSAADRYR